MRTVIEGMDGTGKSTLASLLHDATGWHVVRWGDPPTDVMRYFATVGEARQLAREHGHIIYDRHPLISDAVYGPGYFDGALGMRTDEARWIADRLHESAIGRVIWCDVDDPRDLRIEARDTEVDQAKTAGLIAQAPELLEKYTNLMTVLRHYGVNVIRYVILKGAK